jgi:hypothetical protein
VLQDDYTFDAIKRLPKEELVGQIESKFPCKLTGENCTCVGVEVLRRQPVAVYSSTDAFFQYKTRCKYRFFHAPVSNVDFVLSRLGSADLEILRISE